MQKWINAYAYLETPVGTNGYYAKRKTKYGFKLVKADRCPHYTEGALVKQAIGPQSEKRRKLLEKRGNKHGN